MPPWLGFLLAVGTPTLAQEPAEVSVTPGTWGVQLEMASKSEAPVVRDVESTMFAWALTEVGQDEDGWYHTHRVCEAEVRGTSGIITTIIPAAYVAHMPRRRLRPVVRRDGDRWTWEVDLGPVYAGYHHEQSPDAVPTSADHPAVYDSDEDGQVGATILMEVPLFPTIEIYIAQAGHIKLMGWVAGPEDIGGPLVMARQERVTIGASNRLFDRDVHTWPMPEASRFFMRRLPDGTPCEHVRALMETP